MLLLGRHPRDLKYKISQMYSCSYVSKVTILENNENVRIRINGLLHDAVMQIILPYRKEFSHFIASVVNGWDTRDMANRIELNVGKDLQFIRINGTLVGGLVGLSVHILWELFMQSPI